MKILLIGEFSGVHNNLKKGLMALGHEVKLAADGDGYRKFGYDYQIAPFKGKYLGRIKNVIYLIFNLRKFIGFDVVQFISPTSIPYYYSFVLITYLIFKGNKKKIYYACGTDPAFLASKNKFEYFPFDDPNDPHLPNYNMFYKMHYRWFIKQVDNIVPAMYTYAVGYKKNPKLTQPIPLPDSGCYAETIMPIGEKIKILFGITRKGFKGASYIIEALEKIKKNYNEKIEITIIEKLSFEEYKRLLKSSDILIDQCKSYDYGMNAIIGMENGIIVLSGAEPKAISYLEANRCPVININPNSIQIYDTIESLLSKNTDNLNKLKRESLKYVTKYHSLDKISNSFLEIYLD